MIKIKFKKTGLRNTLSYHIIVTQATSTTKSKYIDKIGFYKPCPDKWNNKYLFIDFDKLGLWLERGALMNIKLASVVNPLLALRVAIKEEERKREGKNKKV